MKKKLDVRIAWVAALAVWCIPAFAAPDRCASPSAEEFARNPELLSSASEIRDIAAGVRRKAEPLIAASVAREREEERERQAEQARLRAEREAEQARRQAEWEAGRPEREARIEARKRERARQRELDRRDAAIRRQNWEAGRPEREARREARKRERARQRESDLQDATIRRQRWDNALNATIQGIQILTGAHMSSDGDNMLPCGGAIIGCDDF